MLMKWKSLFAAALTAAVALPAWAQDATGGGTPFTNGRSISVNFATGQSTGQSNVTNNVSGDALFGLDEVAVAGSQWDNITGATGTDVALKVNGEASDAKMTFKAVGTWSINDANTELGSTNALLGSFLDDSNNTNNGLTGVYSSEITVSAIPFETYDVYLYSNVNNGSGFAPIEVNGDYYTFRDGATVITEDPTEKWGTVAQNTPAYGTNVLVVRGLTTDTLTIKTRKRTGGASQGTDAMARGSFAGFQIVERVPPTISVNFIGTNGPTSIKTKDGFSGLIGVANANWNEGASSGTGASPNNAETDMALVDNQGDLTTATLTYAMGGAWSAGTNTNRDALLGEMGKGYCDNPTTENTVDLSLRNVPYTSYSLILYYGTDKTATTIPWSAPKVTDAEGVSKWYSYPADYEGDAAQASETEVASWGTVNTKTGAYGDDVMLIENLSGDIDVDLGVRRDNGIYGSLCGFQIVCTGEVVGALAPSSVMSLNFASGGNGEIATSTVSDQTGNFGLAAVPAETWVDLTVNENADRKTVTTLHGEADVADWEGATVTWSAANSWSYKTNQVTDETEPFLKTYLDDGDGEGDAQDDVGARVTVKTLPFAAYDVIVYNATDSGKAFYPVTVNDTLYTWDDSFGTIATDDSEAIYGPNEADAVSGLPTATLGTNALRVNGLTDSTLSIQGVGTNIDGNSETYVRAGIAAVQIVARKLITVSTQTDWTTLSAGLSASDPVLIVFTNDGSITGDVTLPADTILDFSGYTFGETAPFTDSLTMNGGTIRLPDGFESGRIATFFSGNNFHCFIAGKPVWLSKNPGDGALSVSYMWTGYARDNRWSTSGNWSSLVVPGKNADVLFMPAASRPETVILDTAATVASVTITGPASGTADLTINGAETASLTVSGQMLTTGNVTVNQSADITVNGETKVEVINEDLGISGSTQAGFHVHQGTWQIRSGTLSMPTDRGANTGEAGISGNGTLIVGGEGASKATLAVRQIRTVYYNKDTRLANGTLRVATDGTLKASSSVQLPGQSYTTELAGGTIETPTLITFAGATVSADSFLRAPTGGATVRTQSRTNDALTGKGGVTLLSGTVTIESELTGYTGTLTVSEGAALTLSDDARPSLVLEDNASLTVTPTPNEIANTSIVFPTSMTTKPENVTYTVNDVTKAITVTVDDNEDTLTLSWEVKRPTLSTTSDWSTTANWTNLPDGTTTYPTSDSVTLDGTAEGGITVTLDKSFEEMKIDTIFVKGKVTLETTEAQPTIPACVKLTTGATLTIDANFSGLGNDKKWTLPDGTTLQVTKGFTSFANLKLEGAVVILSEASGTAESPTVIEAPSPVEFNGGLTIAASNLTLESVYNVGKTLELAGDNITIAGNRFFTDTGTQVVNTGTDNAITGMTGLNGSLAVKGGTLALTLGASPTNTFSGATIAKGATLTLAGPSGWFPATGAGTLVLEGDYRPLFSAVTVGETSATDIPAKMILSATADEQDKGLVSFQTYTGTSGEVTIPYGFVAEVKPYDEAPVWVPVCVRRNSSYIDIYNVPAPNGVAGLEEAVALAIRRAAAEAGVTDGNYTVQLRTKGGQTTIPSPDADALNDVLGCFIGLKATADAEGTTLTYAYDFGIVGIKRNTTDNGWVVTAKVQGANAGAGFAEGNVYTLTVNGEEVSVTDATVGEGGTVELTLPDGAVTGDAVTLGVKVSRPAQTLAQ